MYSLTLTGISTLSYSKSNKDLHMVVFVVTLALCGLFLFLGFSYQQKAFNKRTDSIIEQAAALQIDLEHQLSTFRAKAEDYDRVTQELVFARHQNQNVIPLEHYLSQVASIEEAKAEVSKELEDTKEQLDSVKGKQISERVRLGQVGENLLPFLAGFPYEPKRVRGLFQPIDLLVFNDDEIVFVEVKTGDAKLTEKQRNIQRLIEEGKVRFEVHRLSDKGYEVK